MSEEELNVIAEKVISLTKDTPIGPSFCKFIREKLDRIYGPAWHVIVNDNL